MKKALLLTLIAGIAILNCFATVRTVNNLPTSTFAQYNNIQAAVNACNDGDTVYVHGSPNSYSGFGVSNKRLVIMGPGWSPDKPGALTAIIASSSGFSGSGCNRSELQGLVFNASVGFGPSGDPDSIRIIRNRFNSSAVSLDAQHSVTYSNYLFEGNVFSDAAGVVGLTTCSHQNFVFQNNYFYRSGIINFSQPSSTVLFNHNLFFTGTSGEPIFNGCAYLLLTNNIFSKADAASGNSSSTFSNNITFNTGNNTPWNSNSNIDAGGNIANTDPQMVSQSAVNSASNNPLNDFTIASGPANNTGSDGKDIGLLFDSSGSLNWTNSRNSRLPRIYTFNVSNPVINSGGTLNIQVEGRKSN